MTNKRKLVFYAIVLVQIMPILACGGALISTPYPHNPPTPTTVIISVDRETKIPATAVKMSPETDVHPPLVYSSDFELPVPVPGAVNTAGTEDSPFITLDGNSLYFFFTPDVNVPVEKQILDVVTGIYLSHKVNDEWSAPERIILQDPGKLAMDGCEYVLGNMMWFCSTREGYSGVHWFTAEYENGLWQNWKLADFNPEYQVGELHFSPDGSELYFGSARLGGKGGLDIWLSEWISGTRQAPINISAVNTIDSEGWPAISPAGNELWFTRNYAIWRSTQVNGEWQEPQQIVSPLAGEPTLDQDGNLYFVHHYFIDDRMIEADIYVAYRK